jgi:WXXGXW repeat (2 copies)
MRIVRSLGFVLFIGFLLTLPAASQAQVAIGVSVRIGPPALPVYAQPVCPGPGYIWTPGYWAWGDEGYYWVPGTWVMAPEPGLLWTPGYWGFANGAYIWHAGYWGPHVGFYGGINYGYGYTGVGFWGGEWRGREFVYNRAVTNVNVTVIHNYYNRTVVVNNVNRVSFNGGHGGIMTRPTHDEERWAHERHIEARHEQFEHERAARSDRRFWASENHGRPAIAASGRPGDFHGRNVVAAREVHDNRRDDARRGGFDRPDTHGRDDRPDHGRGHDADFRGDAGHGNPHADRDRGPKNEPHGVARGNPRVGNDHVPSHPDSGRGNNKPEHGKDHGKPDHH